VVVRQTLQMRTQRTLVSVAMCSALLFAAAACAGDDDSSSPSNTLAEPSTTTTVVSTTVVPTTKPAVPTTQPATTVPATTTTLAPTTTVEATTTTAPPGASLSIRSGGIADAPFGADPNEVIAYVSGVIGDPTEDSGWVDAISRTCPGTEVRFVRWGDLTLLFGDESEVESGRRHFFAWDFGPADEIDPSPAGLATPEGISIGSSVVDIGRVYPNATLFEGDELATASAQIDESLFAFLTDTRDLGVITAMVGGQGCGE